MKKLSLFYLILLSIFLISCQTKETTFSIEFDVNGADTTFDVLTNITLGSEITLPTLTMDHYDFLGWYEETTGEKVYLNGSIIVSKSMKLIAEWSPHSYKVTFYDGLNVIDEQQVTYLDSALSPTPPEKEGYHFTGWNTSFNNITEDKNVYATYQINTYVVVFKDINDNILSEQSVVHGMAVNPPEAPLIEGNAFLAWSYNVDEIMANVIIYPIYEKHVFTITFYDENHEALEEVYVRYQEEAIPTLTPSKDGHSFVGWDKDLNHITSNLDVYPIFEVNTYQITLYGIDGEVIDNIDLLFGSTLPTFDIPMDDVYAFSGWYIDASLTESLSFTTMPGYDLSIYSKWTHLSLVGPEILGYQNPTLVDYKKFFNPLRNVSAIDLSDGNLTESIIVTGWSNDYVNHPGEYEVTLSVEDSDGNMTTISYTVIVGEIYYDTLATFNVPINPILSLNPHTQSSKEHSELFNLIGDVLYRGDFDWAKAIELGLATEVGDFTNTASLPFTYVPSMAVSLPVDVHGGGLVFDITLRNDLSFIDGTIINAYTFYDSWKALLSPQLLNQNAYYLFNKDYLPLINAEAYYNQLTPDIDTLGFIMYTVGEVQFTRANAYFGLTTGGYDIYHVENKYENLIGPEGVKAFVEFWGLHYANYGTNGWVLGTQADTYFRIGTDNKLYAPSAGWTLDGVPVPHILPINVYYKSGAAGYAGALPAYMDELGNRTPVTTTGIPVGGVETYDQATPVTWEEVGFEVINALTIRLHLTDKKTSWQVMESLSTAVTSVIHPTLYENGFDLDGKTTNYGTVENPYMSFGRYQITEWSAHNYLMLSINLDHFDHEAYRIQHFKYHFINDQSIIFNEFVEGRLDVSPATGFDLSSVKDSPYLKFTPSTSFFRFAFSLDRMNDGDPSNDNPMLKYVDFRKALYFATDREYFTTYIRYPGYPSHGLLGPTYFSSPYNLISYRTSIPGQAVLADYAPETFGYDPIRAKELFDRAYAQAVADGVINEGDIVTVELVYVDTGCCSIPFSDMAYQWQSIFGSKFELILTSDTQVRNANPGLSVWDSGIFDIAFHGWGGLQYYAPAMLQVYSNDFGLGYIFETGFETGNAILEVELAAGKQAVQQWLDELLQIAHPTSAQMEQIDLFQDFLADFEGNIYTNTYDFILEKVYYLILSYDFYEGREDDFDRITAALEKEILDQMINIPLYNTTTATIYSERVIFDALAYHARMGFGGYRYMYIQN